jgi:hypothetical protein
MVEVRSSETSVNFYETTRRHILEYSALLLPHFVPLSFLPPDNFGGSVWGISVFMSGAVFLCLLNQYALPALLSNYKLQCPSHNYGVSDVLVLDKPYLEFKARG